ncbi:MAG: folylpolyglutamate synthase/dihydrofolate synthase family protein [Pirellulaceae bacterium]|nr:folylpolyglutamate synthase/dihydrofolate synthase family protein [Pirellulaceae bacterium]
MRPPPVHDYPSALEFLLGRVNYERMLAIPYQAGEFKLDRMRRLLSLLGDPHLALAAIHIAGTKGKGSTAAMLAEILVASGRQVGLYTSPHLDSIEERIALGGSPCPRADFVRLAAELAEAVARLPADASDPLAQEPTFFEITTAMALLYYAQVRVDAAVLEVGLGGRLDSTNVCRPLVCIITSISFDHTKQLGNTLAAIAGEKAGIIKPGVPVVSGVVLDEPRDVIRAVAQRQSAPLIERGIDFDFAYDGRMSYRQPAGEPIVGLEHLELGMVGQHQAANAATAIAAARQLNEQGWGIEVSAIRQGIAGARCPARAEVVAQRPTVLLDVAHNVASVAALVELLREQFPSRRRVLVFASSRDKDTAGMLRLLWPEFDAVVLTRYVNNPRAVELDDLQALATATSATATSAPATIQLAANPTTAWQEARQLAGPNDLVCITGSFFLAAELRPLVGQGTLETGRP